MAILALREFECTLCQQHFTLLSGDLILPGPRVCDECLQVLWELEGDALEKHISESLRKASHDGERLESHIEKQALVNSTVQHIQWHKEQWRSAEEAIQARERERRSLA
jgi:hypothetical protein